MAPIEFKSFLNGLRGRSFSKFRDREAPGGGDSTITRCTLEIMRVALTLGRGSAWRFAGSLGLAGLLAIVLAIPANAAIFAMLSSPYGRPGDEIVLTTDDFGNHGAYRDLATHAPQPLYLIGLTDYSQMLAHYGQHVCGTPGQTRLGLLRWHGDVGSATFTIPDVPKGDYFFLINVDANAQPPCWRMGGSGGPLTLTVGDQPANRPSAEPSSVSTPPQPTASRLASIPTLAVGVGAIALVVLLGLALFGRLRHQ